MKSPISHSGMNNIQWSSS